MADPNSWPTVELNGRRHRLAGPRATFPDAYRGLRAGDILTVRLYGPVPPPWDGASTVGVWVGEQYAGVVNAGRLEPHIIAACPTHIVTAVAVVEWVAQDLGLRVHLPGEWPTG